MQSEIAPDVPPGKTAASAARAVNCASSLLILPRPSGWGAFLGGRE